MARPPDRHARQALMIDDDDDTLTRSLFQTLGVLAEGLTTRETHGAGHPTRVSQIARTLSQMYGLSVDVTAGIRLAATLHDYGQLFVPAEILNKPDRLTEEEYAIVKKHPVLGFEALEHVEFPWPVAQAVLQHHERLDGSGYPSGLSGNDIILEARIVAVADVMDAMTSDRPWRKALSVGEALSEIQKGAEALYDGAIVEACVELYTKQSYRLDPEYYGRG
jgi:HD-GYP domain-containing protein (c-di-GMP phosphodiesterase class II)